MLLLPFKEFCTYCTLPISLSRQNLRTAFWCATAHTDYTLGWRHLQPIRKRTCLSDVTCSYRQSTSLLRNLAVTDHGDNRQLRLQSHNNHTATEVQNVAVYVGGPSATSCVQQVSILSHNKQRRNRTEWGLRWWTPSRNIVWIRAIPRQSRILSFHLHAKPWYMASRG